MSAARLRAVADAVEIIARGIDTMAKIKGNALIASLDSDARKYHDLARPPVTRRTMRISSG
jgi:hypothetical protein